MLHFTFRGGVTLQLFNNFLLYIFFLIYDLHVCYDWGTFFHSTFICFLSPNSESICITLFLHTLLRGGILLDLYFYTVISFNSTTILFSFLHLTRTLFVLLWILHTFFRGRTANFVSEFRGVLFEVYIPFLHSIFPCFDIYTSLGK